jgi:glycosyltransferase involved in cell wall biosynthesis
MPPRAVGLPLRIAGPRSNPAYYSERILPRLGDDVTYVGHLAHRDLAKLIGGASVALCTPCWEEPYGLVVAEALACGTPVAAFRRGGIPAIVDETCGALAEPDDVTSLAAAIRAALTIDRAACRRRAEAHCNAHRMVDCYEQLYRRLTSRTADLAQQPDREAALALSA